MATLTERADTGAVDPTDYVPTDKSAPIPESDAPGIVSADIEVSRDQTRVKPPRHKTAQRIIDGAKDAVRSVTGGKDTSGKQQQRPVSKQERLAAFDAEDKRRLRAKKRYAGKTRALLSPIVRIELRSLGYKGLDPSIVDLIVAELCKEKRHAGYMVKGQEVVSRDLPLDHLLAYTLGAHYLKIDDAMADQWLKHPTLFDAGTIVMALVDIGVTMTDEESPLRVAIRRIVESSVKVQARVSDVTPEATSNAAEPESD